MRTLLLGLLTVVLSLVSFFPTAHADVIDPGDPYRKPHRPEIDPIPVTKVYKMREPGFTLKKAEETKHTYLLQVTLPGPCEWEYKVYEWIDGDLKKIAGGGGYSVQDLKTKSDSREFDLQLPEGREKAELLVAVDFCLYRFQETRYGPKIIDTNSTIESVEGVYELTLEDGKQVLKKL
jgi:hypothetical protein